MHRVRKENTEEEDDEGHILDGVADEENTDKDRNWENVPAEVGDFISYVYESNWYIRKVIEKDPNDGEIKVEFMKKDGKLNDTFKWQTKADVLWITNDAILCCIPRPQANGKSKRMFQVSEIKAIDQCFEYWLKNNQ